MAKWYKIRRTNSLDRLDHGFLGETFLEPMAIHHNSSGWWLYTHPFWKRLDFVNNGMIKNIPNMSGKIPNGWQPVTTKPWTIGWFLGWWKTFPRFLGKSSKCSNWDDSSQYMGLYNCNCDIINLYSQYMGYYSQYMKTKQSWPWPSWPWPWDDVDFDGCLGMVDLDFQAKLAGHPATFHMAKGHV